MKRILATVLIGILVFSLVPMLISGVVEADPPPPEVTGVDPTEPFGWGDCREWLGILGAGFVPESEVILRTPAGDPRPIPDDRTTYRDSGRIDVYVGLSAGTWTAQVVNAEGQESKQFPFDVRPAGPYVVSWTGAAENGWYNPLGSGTTLDTSNWFDFDSHGYICNHGRRHAGVDFMAEPETPVHTISSGTVQSIITGVGLNERIWIKHDTTEGSFFAVYGHITVNATLKSGTKVTSGQQIGTIKRYDPNNHHLHFGINVLSWTQIVPNCSWPHNWGQTTNLDDPTKEIPDPRDLGWRDPIEYLENTQNGGGRGPVDVVLIIDDSGSMSWNDPSYMRRQAARLFIDAMQNEDLVGIVKFTGSATTLWPIQTLGADRTQVKNSLSSLSSSGSTSLSAGLSAGYQQLLTVDSSGNDKAAVFLTDGVGTYNNEAQLYAAKGWPIYVLGLGSDIDAPVLQQIADDSGGEYQHLDDASQMQSVYNKIATAISGGSMILDEWAHLDLGVTLQFETALTTDAVVGNFFVGWGGSTVDLSLIAPNGTAIGPDTTDPNIYHSKSSTYELYRIDNPMPGIWTLLVFGSDLPPGGEDIVVQVSVVSNIPTEGNPPVADAGPDQTVLTIPPATTAMVTLDGSGSHDPDGDLLTYNWTWDGNTACGVSPTVELPPGTTTIALVVNDGQLDSEPDTVDITVRLQAAVDFDPDTSNLKSKGKFVTAYIELPSSYDVAQIDVSTISLNGTVPALPRPTEIGDYDKDDIPDLMVKFDRAAVQSVIGSGESVEVTVTGEVAGVAFEGRDTIRVKDA